MPLFVLTSCFRNFSVYIPVLQNRNFLLLLAGTASSALGSAVLQIVLTTALLKHGYSAQALGGIYTSELIPVIAFSLLGGVVGDKFSRRHVMICADLLRCATQLALATCFFIGWHPVFLISFLTILMGLGHALFSPSATGLLVSIVHREHVQPANSVILFSLQVSAICGPLLAGMVVNFGGSNTAIVLDSLTYGLSAGCLFFVAGTHIKAGSTSLRHNLKGGLEEFRKNRWLPAIALKLAFSGALVFAPFAIFAPILILATPNGIGLWSTVVSAAALGTLAGNITAAHVNLGESMDIVEVCLLTLCLLPLALATNAPPYMLVAASAIGGASAAMLSIFITAKVQTSISQARLSSVSSILMLSASALTPLGFLISPLLAQIIGMRSILIISPIVLFLSTTGVAYLLKR